MSAGKPKIRAIETKPLPFNPRMLALEPRYVFDAAAGTELYDASHDAFAGEGTATAPARTGSAIAGTADERVTTPDSGFSSSGATGDASNASPTDARKTYTGAGIVAAADELARLSEQVRNASDAGFEALRDPLLKAAIAAHNLAPFNHEIAFIDSRLADLSTLVAAVPEGTRIVLIDAARDGIAQVVEALRGRNDITGVHLVSHGSAGTIALGSATLDARTMAGEYQAALAAIGASLTSDADILIYGCNFAAGEKGAEAAALLAKLTGADVAASEDLTGAQGQGGDWDLEVRSGAIEAQLLTADSWDSVLAPLVIQASSNPVVVGGGGVGTTALWTNAGTIGGTSIDLRATVVSFAPGFPGATTPFFGTLGDDVFVQLTQQSSIVLRWEIFASGTNQTVFAVGSPEFRISDIDGVGGSPFTRESVSPQLNGLQSYTVNTPTNVQVSVVGGELRAAGTQDQNGEVTSMVGFTWLDVSSWEVRYQLHLNDPTIQARFLHDGDGDFVFTSANQTSLLGLDLDTDNSTAPGTSFETTFTEGGASVHVVDSDVAINQHPALGTSIGLANVRFANAQAGDELLVNGSSAGNGTITVGSTVLSYALTSTGGGFEVAISGDGTLAEYQAALQSITFRNVSQAPSTIDRVVTVDVTNTTFGTSSNVATTTIKIVAVNDTPDAVDASTTTPYGTPVVVDLLANDTDPENDPLSVTAAAVDPAQGMIAQNPVTGSWTFTPATGFSGVATITYTIRDPAGATDTAVHTVTVANGVPALVDPDPTPGTPSIDPADPTKLRVPAIDGMPLTVPLATYFTDPNGDPLTITPDLTGLPAWLSYDPATQTFAGTPPADNTGVAVDIPVMVSDGKGGLVPATITISPTNPPPVAATDTVNTASATPVVVALLANDVDPDNDPLTVTAAALANPGHGTLVEDPATGTWTFTPAIGFAGPATINYTITDQDGATASSTHVVIVAPNDPPTLIDSDPAQGTPSIDPGDARNLLVPVTDNVPMTLAVAQFYADANGDPLAIAPDLTGLPAWLSYDSVTRTLSGTPPVDNTGPVVVPVLVDDGKGGVVATTITITPSNPGPDAVAGVTSTPFNTPVAVDLLGNDTDPDNDPLTVTSATVNPAEGTITQDALTGVWTFTPAATFSGTAVITYSIRDQDGATGTATHAVTVPNAPPRLVDPNPAPGTPGIDPANPTNLLVPAVDGSALTLPLTTYFVDPNGDPLTISPNPSAIPSWLSFDPATGTFTGTPPVDNTGAPVVIPVVVQDNRGGTYLASVTITPTNPAPDAVDATSTTPFQTPIAVALLANDTDPDSDPLSVTSATLANPAQGTLLRDPVTGVYTFTPAPGFSGNAVINYTIRDQDGATDTATHTVTVANAVPRLIDPDLTPGSPHIDPANPTNLLVPAVDGVPLVLPIATYFTDPNGDPLTISPNPAAIPPWLAYDPVTRSFSGTPPADNTGAPVVIPVLVDDGNGGAYSATVTFAPVNPGPDAVDDSTTTAFGTAVVVPLLGNDTDPDNDLLTVTAATVANPADGSLIQDLATGVWTFTPAPGFTGTALINYTIQDQDGAADAAVHAVHVGPGNRPPVLIDPAPGVPGSPEIDPANPSNLLVPSTDGVPLTLDVSDYFSDPNNDPLTVAPDMTGAPNWLTYDPSTQTFSGTPPTDNAGPVVIPVTVTDGSGGTFTGSITIGPVNPAPDAVDATSNTPHGTSIVVDLVGNDTDPDNDPLTITSATLADPASGTLVQDPVTLAWTFTPAVGFSGAAVINYSIADQDGATDIASHIVTVGPGAIPDSITTPANTPVTGNVSANDSAPIGSVFAPAGLPAHGTLTMAPDGSYVYIPATGFAGTDSFTYTVTDPTTGLTSTATATIAVIAPALPVAVNDFYTTPYGVSMNGDATTGDTFVAGSTFTVLNQPTNGTLTFNADGTYTFTPSIGFVGTETFAYQITTPFGQTATAVEVIRVTPPAIVAVNDTATTLFNTPVNGDVSAGDTFAAGSTFIAITSPMHGTLSFNADGTYVYTPNPGYVGPDMFAYAVTDPIGQTRFATSLITVSPPPGPTAVDDSYSGSYLTPVSGTAAAGDTYLPGSTFAVISQPTHGALVFNADGTFTYAPAAGFAGTDSFTYRITDPNGNTATATGTTTVAAPLLTAVDDTFRGVYGVPVNGNAAVADAFAPGSTFAPTSQPTHGTLVFNPDGSYVYTPAAGFAGTDTFTYRITDPTGRTVVATETIVITPPVLVAADGNLSAVANAPANGNAAAGDQFAPGSTFAVANGPARGTVAMNPDGTYVYTPPANFAGTVTFTYRVTDPTGQVATATETIVVSAPSILAVHGTNSTPFGTSVSGSVAGNDTFPVGSIFSAVTSPTYGSLTMNADGSYRYVPADGYSGPDSFTYRITDPFDRTVTAIETITVGAANPAHRCLTTFGSLRDRIRR